MASVVVLLFSLGRLAFYQKDAKEIVKSNTGNPRLDTSKETFIYVVGKTILDLNFMVLDYFCM